MQFARKTQIACAKHRAIIVLTALARRPVGAAARTTRSALAFLPGVVTAAHPASAKQAFVVPLARLATTLGATERPRARTATSQVLPARLESRAMRSAKLTLIVTRRAIASCVPTTTTAFRRASTRGSPRRRRGQPTSIT